jgi:hypothetical protein
MTNVLPAASLALALTVAACAAPADDGRTGGASQALQDDNGAWRPIAHGRGGPLSLHADHAYGAALAERCGPGYALDVVVDVGPVTADFLQIDAVSVSFRTAEGHAVVPRKLDVWSDLTADKQVADGAPHGNGESVRYDVTRAYMLDPRDPIVVLELQTAGSTAAADLACRHTTRFVLYPAGAPVDPPRR